MKSGLHPIQPDKRDYSLLHTFGAIVEPSALPDNYSIYDGRIIPNQNLQDNRFTPPLDPLPYGCTGETGAFESGIQDGVLYDPKDLYVNTPPGGWGGRQMRDMLQTLIDRGPRDAQGNPGPKRLAYFNCYGAGKIDDFDAARIGLWINQNEKRGVYAGTFWYWGMPGQTVLFTPSYDTRYATLHCWLVTGWRTVDGVQYLEVIPWVGQGTGDQGKYLMTREIYNKLMTQPYTGAFTITKQPSNAPIPIGYQAVIDHLVAFIRNLFGV